MPILPENRKLYPANWATEIRPAILKRAGNRCEWCKKPNGKTILSVKYEGVWYWIDAEHWFVDPSGIRSVPCSLGESEERSRAKIVLTIAHLDHDPTNNEPDNLRALCQRCHNTYDAPRRAANRKRRK